MSALQSAIDLGRPLEEVRKELFLVFRRTPDGGSMDLQPAMEAAARRGDLEIVRLLHDNGAGCTHATMTEAIRANSIEVSKFMLTCDLHHSLLEGLWLHFVRAKMEGRPVIAAAIQTRDRDDRAHRDGYRPFHFEPPKKRERPARLVLDLVVVVALAILIAIVVDS